MLKQGIRTFLIKKNFFLLYFKFEKKLRMFAKILNLGIQFLSFLDFLLLKEMDKTFG